MRHFLAWPHAEEAGLALSGARRRHLGRSRLETEPIGGRPAGRPGARGLQCSRTQINPARPGGGVEGRVSAETIAHPALRDANTGALPKGFEVRAARIRHPPPKPILYLRRRNSRSAKAPTPVRSMLAGSGTSPPVEASSFK